MRVTNNMMISQLMYNLEKNLNVMSKKQDELATGKRVMKASDDPIDASKILKYKSDISEFEQFSTNTRDAQGWLEVTESSISDTSNVMIRLKELAVQAANGTYSSTETNQISKEVEQLKKQIITNGNINYAGRYLFSGFQTGEKFFKDDGTINIDITNNEINNVPRTELQIGVGETLEISTNGIDVFGVVTGTTAYDSIMADAASTNGIKGKKTELVSAFDLDLDYTGDTLDLVVGGTTYTVDSSNLNGSNSTLSKTDVMNAFNDATGGAGTLSDVADVYFDQSNNLIIKSKTSGAITMSQPGPLVNFSGSITTGNPTTEASVSFGGQTFDDTFVASNSAELVSTPFYITYNGERKAVKLDQSLVLSTTADLQAGIQNALDRTFGTGSISATLNGVAPNESIQLTTVGTTGNTSPSIGVELVVSSESSLIRDIDNFITALVADDKTGIQTFVAAIPDHHNRILESQAEIGAKVNRIELVQNRITDNVMSFTKMLSDAQDADISETIMKLKNAENVYKSALSTGARVIQPTLIDFLR